MPDFLDDAATQILLAIIVVAGTAALPRMFRLAFGRRGLRGASRRRAHELDALALGRGRRLALMRDPLAERLILLGGPTDVVVESSVAPTRGAPPPEEGPPIETEMLATGFAPPPSELAGLFRLGLLALVAGVAVGLLCGSFRLVLVQAGVFRDSIPIWLRDRPALGLATMMLGAAFAAGVATYLVRRFVPSAAGSGIPHVESVIDGGEPPASPLLLPVKYVGGALAIGAGLALGREGPSVQMGATLAHQFARLFRCDWRDTQALLASGAGAGLAAAFNAPLAGAAFVLEELLRRFDMRHATTALGASVGAIAVVRLMDGPTPELRVSPHFEIGGFDILTSFALGAVAGAVSLPYNRAILGALDIVDGLRWPVERTAAIVGAAVGALAFFAPDLVGGGDELTQITLDGAFLLTSLPLVFTLRFVLGVVSYAAGTPGGLFAPLLALGAELGFLCGLLLPSGEPLAKGMMFAIIGMAAFFSAVVRAPLTGMILITEMTDSSELLLPMLAACFAAMGMAAVIRNEPIYDALKERAARLARRAREEAEEEALNPRRD
jgi:CIC family chloride channel protein